MENLETAAPQEIFTAAQTSKAWPFEEARKLVKRFPGGKRDAVGELVPVLFETGYGPSGLPHIGTFQEVTACARCRTTCPTSRFCPKSSATR